MNPVVINVGGLVKDKYYKMGLFFMERNGGNYVKIEYKKTSNYKADFTNLLVNLLPGRSSATGYLIKSLPDLYLSHVFTYSS